MNDKYGSFAELANHEKEGRDYRVEIVSRGSPFSVFAIHGGKIETWTTSIARAIAGDDLNLYLFEGVKPDNNWDLHVTSHRFDEPRALALAKKSRFGISIHGAAGMRVPSVCLGGANEALRDALASSLARVEPPIRIENPCRAFPGDHPHNPINLCREAGVQLELSRSLRRSLVENPVLLARFARSIRTALVRFG